MSLTAHILFNQATELPRGIKRTHRMDSWWKSGTPESVYAREHCALEKAANIEKVFASISQGVSTALEIESAVGLSLATVQKALHELEDWADGPRIIRIRGKVAHRFEVVPPDEEFDDTTDDEMGLASIRKQEQRDREDLLAETYRQRQEDQS